MNKIVNRTFCLLLCLLLAFAAGGCVLPDSAQEFEGETSSLVTAGSPYKHYFERLSDKEKMAYNAILAVISTFPERIEVPVLTHDELNKMYAALLYDNPELFFLSSETIMRTLNNRAYLYPDYRMDISDYNAMYSKCSEIAAQIADAARAGKTAFDRERAVHDRLIASCAYTDDEANIYKGTIYGALCGGEAACEGYAKTAKLLLDLLDIPCFVVHGNSTPPGSRTQSHMWNAVQLDGEWYYLDLTWDDPVLEKGGEIISYSYFNVTEEALRRTHKDFDSDVECTATKNNFFVHENLMFSSLDEEEMKRAVSSAAQMIDAGSDGFQLCFADSESFEDAKKALFEEEKVYALLKQIEEKTERSFKTNRVTYFTTDEVNTIEILLVS